MDGSYYDPKAEVQLAVYADTVIVDREAGGERLQGIRFGGYPEMVRAMSDAIYGGAMEVYSIAEKMDAWVLELWPEDRNVVEAMEEGLKEGEIVIPGSAGTTAEEFEKILHTDYLDKAAIAKFRKTI